MSLYGLHNVNLDRDLLSVTLGFDFLFTPNNKPLRDNVQGGPKVGIQYIV